MEYRDLSYLLEVASAGHLGRAAEKLGLTQPALTKCVARLEQEFGVPLIERTARGVMLTTYGLRLKEHAERAHAANLDIRRELSELSKGLAGHLRIGTGMVLAQHVLPKACLTLLKRYPDITLEVVTGNTDTLFPALRERKLDLVLASVVSNTPEGFRQISLMEDKVAVISRAGHRLQSMHRINARALVKERWAMPAHRTVPDEWLIQRCRQLGIHPLNCVLRTGALPTLLPILAETDLLAFQSWPVVSSIENYGELLRPLPIEQLTWRRQVGITIRDSGYVPPAIHKLIEVLRETAARACMA